MGPSDDELMSRYRDDADAQAFETLFQRHAPSIFNLARTLLSCDAGTAEEVLQETFLSVARSAQSYEPRGYFRTWLFRIARNRCLNRIESRRALRAVDDRSLDVADSVASRQPTPPQRAESAEQLAVLQRAIVRLPNRQREAIALFAFEGMTYADIAHVLDVPTNTVKTLIHRARATLAQALGSR
jgi:RNA polymerase sigma-70 factor (ECF subfamily)